eukprot:gene5394-biopygen176
MVPIKDPPQGTTPRRDRQWGRRVHTQGRSPPRSDRVRQESLPRVRQREQAGPPTPPAKRPMQRRAPAPPTGPPPQSICRCGKRLVKGFPPFGGGPTPMVCPDGSRCPALMAAGLAARGISPPRHRPRRVGPGAAFLSLAWVTAGLIAAAHLPRGSAAVLQCGDGKATYYTLRNFARRPLVGARRPPPLDGYARRPVVGSRRLPPEGGYAAARPEVFAPAGNARRPMVGGRRLPLTDFAWSSMSLRACRRACSRL